MVAQFSSSFIKITSLFFLIGYVDILCPEISRHTNKSSNLFVYCETRICKPGHGKKLCHTPYTSAECVKCGYGTFQDRHCKTSSHECECHDWTHCEEGVQRAGTSERDNECIENHKLPNRKFNIITKSTTSTTTSQPQYHHDHPSLTSDISISDGNSNITTPHGGPMPSSPNHNAIVAVVLVLLILAVVSLICCCRMSKNICRPGCRRGNGNNVYAGISIINNSGDNITHNSSIYSDNNNINICNNNNNNNNICNNNNNNNNNNICSNNNDINNNIHKNSNNNDIIINVCNNNNNINNNNNDHHDDSLYTIVPNLTSDLDLREDPPSNPGQKNV